MKLGYIDYLNCYPFYYHMFEKKPIDGVEIYPAIPSELNRCVKEKILDLSPVSAGAYPGFQHQSLIMPHFCLSSVGYIRSVILRSRLPIEDLHKKKVGLTSASKTSVALLQILLKKYYGCEPHYVPVTPRPSMENLDAALIIGNDAMIESDTPVEYVYDLGDLWLRKTGYPVVFAVFAVQEEALELHLDKVKEIDTSFRTSLGELRNNREEVVKKASAKYPDITYDVGYYYDLFEFDFTDTLKKLCSFIMTRHLLWGFLNL